MKRLWITLLIVAMAVVITIPAGAGDINCDDPLSKPYTPDHPTCTTTTTPDTTTTSSTTIPGYAECVFDSNGVLDSWHGHEDDDRQCIWRVDSPGDEFGFQIKSDPADPVTQLKLAHLIVNADIVFPSPKCFEASQVRVLELPFPADEDDLWTFVPADEGCGFGPYLLTISVQALRSGTVNLVMTQTPPEPPPPLPSG